MNKYVKEYLHRGLIFGGFGPIVTGIVIFCVERSGTEVALNGASLLLAIISTYICAFVHAGSSVFPTIESWSRIKGMFFQLFSLYTVYITTYLLNSWLPLDIKVLSIFTACFVIGFLLIWLIVFLSIKKAEKAMNEKLNSMK